MISGKRALFLDRDGVINEDVKYPHRPDQIRFKDGIFTFCKVALQKGYLLIVVTNQAGVAKGYFTEEDVRKLHAWMSDQFLQRGIAITAFYYCPYHAEGKIPEYRKDSNWRKPNPGMILQAVEDHSIDLGVSLVVGDKPSDRIKLPQLKSIILKSEYTGDDFDVESLQEIEKIL